MNNAVDLLPPDPGHQELGLILGFITHYVSLGSFA